MSVLPWIEYDDRMVGQNSPDYSDTLNVALKAVVVASGLDPDASFVGFASLPLFEQEVADRTAAVAAEATTRANADTTLQTNIAAEATARALAITTEATARANADTVLTNNLNQEIADRIAAVSSAVAYTDTTVGAEATARAAADSTLQTNINTEATARIAGDADTLTAAELYADNNFQAFPVLTGEGLLVANKTFPYGVGQRYGMVADGASDNTTALMNAVTAAAAIGYGVTLLPGRYIIGSDVTVTTPFVVQPGAVVVPSLGATLSLTRSVLVAPDAQWIDESDGGEVHFTRDATNQFFAEWWGAQIYATHQEVWAANFDSFPFFNSALREASRVCGFIQLRFGCYGLGDELIIAERAGIIGYGKRYSFLTAVNDYEGYLFQFRDLFRNPGEDDPTLGETTVTFGPIHVGSRKSSRTGDFSIIGDYSYVRRGFRTWGGTDGVELLPIGCHYLNGTAVQLGVSGDKALMRESNFDQLEVRECGNLGLDEAAIEIGCGSDALDGTNHLVFHRLELQYSLGLGMRIRSSATGTQQTVRRIRFIAPMFHGTYDYVPVTGPVAPDTDVVQLIGRLLDVEISDMAGNGSATGYAVIRMSADGAGFYPRLCRITGNLTTCNGDGIVVEKMDGSSISITAKGADFGGHCVVLAANSIPNVLDYSRTDDGPDYNDSIDDTVQTKVRNYPSNIFKPKITFITSASSPYTPTQADTVIAVNADAGPVTVKLPVAAGSLGRQFVFVRVGTTLTNAITIQVADADIGIATIGGVNSFTMTNTGYATTLYGMTSASWRRVGDVVTETPSFVTLGFNSLKYGAAADGATTLDLANGNFFHISNTAPTTITDILLNGGTAPNGAVCYLYVVDALTTLQSNSNIETLTRADRVLGARSRVTLLRDSSQWRVIAVATLGVGTSSTNLGDADLTYTWGGTASTDSECVHLTTAITAARSLTLSDASRGAKVRVVRDIASTGFFNYNVKRSNGVTICQLSGRGQWADLSHNGTQWNLDAIGSLDNLGLLTIVNNGTSTIDPNTRSGLIVVTNVTDNQSALLLLNGALDTVNIVSDPSGTFSTAVGTGSRVNVYSTGGNYTMENKLGSTKVFRVITLLA